LVGGNLNSPETPGDIVAIGKLTKFSNNGTITIGDRVTDYDLK
jgi:hypothetical protein